MLLILAQPETAREHVANGLQVLVDLDKLFDDLHLIPDPPEIRAALRAVEARLFKALFLLS